jgi:hypothetical protein
VKLAPALLLACVALACRDPFVLLPGGKLDGQVRAEAGERPLPDGYGTGQLETRPEDPYSVNLVYTVLDGRIYVNAGDEQRAWTRNLDTDPNVRLRVDDVIYELRAERVTDRAEIAEFGKAWLAQSSFRQDPASFAQAWVYRLVPR